VTCRMCPLLVSKFEGKGMVRTNGCFQVYAPYHYYILYRLHSTAYDFNMTHSWQDTLFDHLA